MPLTYAYADQNFLSTCAYEPSWRDSLVAARKRGDTAVVLSPLHFYEIGRAGDADREAIIRLVEDIDPVWTYLHADAQLREFLSIWNHFCGNGDTPFQPLVSLHEACAAMHNVHPNRVGHFTLRDWIGAFASKSLPDVSGAIDEQGRAGTANQRRYKRGHMTSLVMKEIDRRHVAVQLARFMGDHEDRRVVYLRAEDILAAQPLGTLIDVFVYWCGTELLKSYQVEAALTTNFWQSKANLRGRLIDRLHATLALPYCDLFVTDDRDLTKRCKAAKDSLRFPTADIRKGAEFIRSI